MRVNARYMNSGPRSLSDFWSQLKSKKCLYTLELKTTTKQLLKTNVYMFKPSLTSPWYSGTDWLGVTLQVTYFINIHSQSQHRPITYPLVWLHSTCSQFSHTPYRTEYTWRTDVRDVCKIKKIKTCEHHVQVKLNSNSNSKNFNTQG